MKSKDGTLNRVFETVEVTPDGKYLLFATGKVFTSDPISSDTKEHATFGAINTTDMLLFDTVSLYSNFSVGYADPLVDFDINALMTDVILLYKSK